ncbi:MAG: hypothetical protein GY827_01305 [Cytophagales bacterium]|nr:hypothetical protein [Cytophagales bacterium]
MKINSNQENRWIGSAGGPCIIISSNDLSKWSGTGKIDAIKDGKYEEADDFMDASQAHYGLACEGFEDIVKVEIDDFEYTPLIIGGEPSQMKFTDTDEQGTFYLVRWVYGESEEEFEGYMSFDNFNKIDTWQEDFHVNIDAEFSLMDSAICGIDIPELDDAGDFISFSVIKGSYEVSTVEYEPDEETCMLIHRFKKKG